MKKIYLGGLEACSCHNEKKLLENIIFDNDDCYLVNDYKMADIIVIIDTCMGTYSRIENSINYIKRVLSTKKSDARVVVSGCLLKKVNFDFPKEWIEILEKTEQVSSNELIKYILNILGTNIDSRRYLIPYSLLPNSIQISPVEGCLNNCSFCKSTYMDFSLRSIPLNDIELLMNNVIEQNDEPINFINAHSSNLSLYGVDLYGKPRAHELISTLSNIEQVKFIQASALINWYPELLKEILNNPKIKSIFISLESGSERIYNLMNRPITLKKLIEIIRTIRNNRPDIIINTEFICGFPTETKDDVDKTIDLVCELDINPLFIHPYENSSQIPASTLPQFSSGYIFEAYDYANSKLSSHKHKFVYNVKNGELLILDKNPNLKMYKVMLVDGGIWYVNYNCFDKEYNVGDIIPKNVSGRSRILRKQV